MTRRRRKRRARKRPFLLYALLAALAAALLLRRTNPPPVAPIQTSALPVRSAATRPRARIVYPHSLIAGGVWSRDELAAALARDPVAAAHYRDFDLNSARTTQLDAPRAAWLSYRLDDRAYWTRRPVVLPAGEPVLTDGHNLARSRCGNRISFVAVAPTGPTVDLDTPESQPEAAPDVFDLRLLAYDLFVPDLTLPDTSNALDGASGQPDSDIGAPVEPTLPPGPEWVHLLPIVGSLPPLIPGIPGDRPPAVLPPPSQPPAPAVENPEPGVALLVLCGILLFGLRRLTRSSAAA